MVGSVIVCIVLFTVRFGYPDNADQTDFNPVPRNYWGL